ncbi:RNA methyltransferase [Candidatus Falkowbacteria bacterium]|nr:MAG: RNA methyltransferase [Candidatus Falkowbacteria bacterium]
MITSTQNPTIKKIIKLQKARERKKENLILIEGRHEISMAKSSRIEIINLFYCDQFTSDSRFNVDIKKELIENISPEVFKKISYRQNPEGYLAIARPKRLDLKTIKLSQKPLVLILEAIEKPGNLGAILRTADAAGVDAVIINDPRVDVYNPNVIRASLGSVFTNKIVVENSEKTLKWLKLNKINSYAATPSATELYTNKGYKNSCAIVVGAEHEGLSQFWLKKADFKVKIPMLGKIDSLNASVSVAILLFEALKQRKLTF